MGALCMTEQNKNIYFSKFIYVQNHGHGKRKTYIQLNMLQHEFSVQTYRLALDSRAVYQMQTRFYDDENIIIPAIKVSHGRNGFIPTLIPVEREEVCIFTYGMKVKEDIINKLKPFCNALDFKPFVNKKSNDEWLPYRDEYTMYFYGFTNSSIPYMFFDMTYDHSNWPTEILWKELYNSLIKDNKKKVKNEIIF